MFDALQQDVRFAVRTLGRAPGFTVAAVATLGLGIGATALVFSMVNTMLLRPFPYRAPEQLALVVEKDMEANGDVVGTSYPNFMSWRTTAKSFASLSGFHERSVSMRVGAAAEHFNGARVSADLFTTLGIEPVAGRTFLPEEDLPGGPRSVILSYELWQKQFNGSQDAIGKTVYINAEAHTVVGVMPPRFAFPSTATLWTPFQLNDTEDRGWRYMSAVGRLKPGVTFEQAQAEMRGLSAQLASAFPGPNSGHIGNVENLQAATTRQVRPVMLILLGAVGFVLLIACANVANLMLSRAAGRDREMAIRSAIGAGGARLIRQLLTESLIIALLGGGLGILAGAWWLDLLVSRLPAETPYWMQFGMDRTVLLFVVVVAVATSIVFGLAPALQAGRVDLQGTLKESGRTTAGAQRLRMRNAFVVAQLAAAIILLVGSLLMTRSILAMRKVDPGFDQKNIVTMEFDAPSAKYQDDARQAALITRVLADLQAVPGVDKAAAVSWFPVSGNTSTSNFSVDGIGEVEGDNAYNEAVTPDYFAAMGIPVVRGRPFDERDRAGSAPVMIVNQKLVDRFFPGVDPIGKRVKFGAGNGPYSTIVGVVGNVNERDVDQKEIGYDMYSPMLQTPRSSASLVVRTRGGSAEMLNGVRERVRRIDPDIAVFDANTVESVLSQATWDSRLSGSLFSFFGVGALLLAGIGLYGVIAYSVSQRTHEIGVRVALGATRNNVIRMVLMHGLKLTALGLVIGLGAAFGLSRVLSSVLFGVTSSDPYTFAIVPVVLGSVAMLATYLPARRATRVSPITALRTD